MGQSWCILCVPIFWQPFNDSHASIYYDSATWFVPIK